jgi:hypothetical protein
MEETFFADLPIHDNDLSMPIGYICMREYNGTLLFSIHTENVCTEIPIRRTNLLSIISMCQLAIACESGR